MSLEMYHPIDVLPAMPLISKISVTSTQLPSPGMYHMSLFIMNSIILSTKDWYMI